MQRTPGDAYRSWRHIVASVGLTSLLLTGLGGVLVASAAEQLRPATGSGRVTGRPLCDDVLK